MPEDLQISPEQRVCAVREILSACSEPPAAMVRSFGCQLNVADGEKLKGLLLSMGYRLTEDPEEAKVILLNTCAVREHAEQRAFGLLGSYKKYAVQNPDVILGLCGCMSAEETVRETLKKSYPYVRLVVGTGAIDHLPAMLYDLLTGTKRTADNDTEAMPSEWIPVHRESTFRASVPVMYGCNNFCTYCIVPYVRGRERSRASADIYREVESLVKNGYREILLLGQNVNSYGRGLEEDIDFPRLLRLLDTIEGDYILRFMSSHPKDASDELIAAMRDCGHVERHLHLPVQCGSDHILSEMNRRYTAADYLDIIRRAREQIPDLSLSTDLMVGFPGETEEDFLDTLRLVETVRYDNIYPFIYSPREGTKAAQMPDETPAAEKTERMQRLLDLQKHIAEENFHALVGQTLPVLVDGKGKRSETALTARTAGGIIVETEGDPALIGQFVTAKITAARNCAVIGALLTDVPVTAVR